MKVDVSKLNVRDIRILQQLADGERIGKTNTRKDGKSLTYDRLRFCRFKTGADTTIELVAECFRKGMLK